MKIRLLLIYISFIILSCKNNEKYDDIVKGSWYNLNTEEKTYEEIHIDDSLCIYCFDNCDVIIPFYYSLKGDSIYLLSNKENILDKYQISFNRTIKREMYLINQQNKLKFIKMDLIYENLNHFLNGFNSLDTLTYDYIKRKNNIMNTLNNP